RSIKHQRAKALDVASKIRMKERGGNATIVQLEVLSSPFLLIPSSSHFRFPQSFPNITSCHIPSPHFSLFSFLFSFKHALSFHFCLSPPSIFPSTKSSSKLPKLFLKSI